MLRPRSLRTRFLIAWGLLIATAIAGGLWSSATFFSLAVSIDQTVRDSQQVIDLASSLVDALEREDDAVLLLLADRPQAGREQLARQRLRGDEALAELSKRIHRAADAAQQAVGEPSAASSGDSVRTLDRLRVALDDYRRTADKVVEAIGSSPPEALADLDRYHSDLNPLLRRAVALCQSIRQQNFETILGAAVQARDGAKRGTFWVLSIAALSILLGAAVATWLTRSVMRPLRRLSASLESIAQGDFDARVEPVADDELGQMAEGVNRMAAALAAYRRSSLGELLESKALLRSTLDALPDAVLLFGPRGTLVDSNPPGRRLLDALGAGDAGSLDSIALPRASTEAIRSALRGRPAGPVKFDFRQAIAVSLDGRPRRLMLTAVPVRGLGDGSNATGDGQGAVVVLDDVTDFVKLDELRSELIAVASHELKSPLTTLRMNLMMLAETARRLDDQQRQLLAAASEGCDELEATIEELLDVTRVEAGKLRLNLDRVDLGRVIGEVIGQLQPRFDDAGVELRTWAPDDRWEVQGDAKRLANVVANLLTNALKYTPAGGVVSFDVQRIDAGGGASVRVAVSDTGCGIPPPYRQRVFEKFFRVEHTDLASDTVDQAEALARRRGTGIGLYLCREIIQAHGGRIWCEAASGQSGTRVVFELPAARLTNRW